MPGKGSQHGLIWARLQQQRDPQLSLSREQIVRAALQIADAEGLQGITMRRVARELGSAAMSLYRHIYSKDDLLDLMLDEAFGEVELPGEPAGDWQAGLRQLAWETRRALKRHPWLAVLLSSRPPVGPNYLRYFEALLGTVARLGLDMKTMAAFVGSVNVFVIGYVSVELGEEESTRQTGLTVEDKHALGVPYLQPVLDSGRFPNLARFVQAGPMPPDDEGFRFGLDCLLSGLAERVLRETKGTEGTEGTHGDS